MTPYKKNEFLRSQIAAFAGTAVDYTTFVILTRLFGVWYVYANIIGAILGAITNFLLGRYWAFNAQAGKIGAQALRYALVSLGSLILNTVGLYFLVEFTPIYPEVAKVVVGIIVAVTYNYLMQQYFVFKRKW